MVRSRQALLLAFLLLGGCHVGWQGDESTVSNRGLIAGTSTPGSSWYPRSPMPLSERGAASVVFDGKILLFGGVASTPAGDTYTGAYEYDPALDTWTSLPPMPVGFLYLTAHAVGDKVLIFGGYSVEGFERDVLAYDPVARSWSQRASRPTYSYNYASAVVDGRVFVIGGHGTIDNGPWEQGKPWVVNDKLEIYDPESDSWSTGAPAPAPVSGGVACAVGRRIYVLGDYTSDVAVTYAYDVDAGSWSVEPSATLTDGQSCVAANGELYVIGGRSKKEGDSANIVQIFSPETHQWREASPLNEGRHWGTASLVGNTVFMFGGEGNRASTLLNSVEALDVGAAP